MTENNWLPSSPIFEPKDVLAKVLDIVENHPEAHDQVAWIDGPGIGEHEYDGMTLKHMQQAVKCGTTCCVAGWVATLAGGKWLGDDVVQMPGVSEKDAWDSSVGYVAGRYINDIAKARGVNLNELFSPKAAREDVIEMLHQMVDDEARQVPDAEEARTGEV